MSRLVTILYLLSLILLPWTWFSPFPWLHEHAQWSDAIFAVAALLWVIERFRLGWPRLQLTHLALAAYFLLAGLSLLISSPNPITGAPKLLGVGELVMLAIVTADIASRPGTFPLIAKSIALTSLVTAAASLVGLALFFAGIGSQLIGIYGELEASRWYARVQAGTYNPNLLASVCIFAATVVSRRDGDLPPWLRRVTVAALSITVLLTFSRGILGFILAAVIRGAVTPRRRIEAAVFAVLILGITLSLTVWKPSINPARPFDASVENVASSRSQAATSSLTTLVTHPIFGSGLGTNPGRYRGLPFDSHCTPLNIAATLGLPALVVVSFLITLKWRGRRRPTDLALWGGLAGLALDGLAQDIEDFRHVWVMIGLAGADALNSGPAPSTSKTGAGLDQNREHGNQSILSTKSHR